MIVQMAARQEMFGLRVPFLLGATRHTVVIPVVISQFHLVGTPIWRVAVWFAYPIIWRTATSTRRRVPATDGWIFTYEGAVTRHGWQNKSRPHFRDKCIASFTGPP